MRERRRTTTSNFGVARRENHDATAFYDRFRPPLLSDDQDVPSPEPVSDPFICGDARRMDAVADGSVALVVTSPPYFAGKQYEEELERDGVEYWLVTSDRELRTRAGGAAARTVGGGAFLGLLGLR